METLVHLIIQYRYMILLPLACFEGPIVSFVVGALAAQGYFNIFAAFGILILGDLIPDAGYYFLGRYGKEKAIVKRSMKKIGVTPEHFGVIHSLWHNHPGKTMFFSKLAYGLSTPFLISAGLVGMESKKFFSFTLPIIITQYGILFAIGYHFSNSFSLVSTSIQDVQYIISGVIVIFVAYYFLTRYMRRKLLLIEKQEEIKESLN